MEPSLLFKIANSLAASGWIIMILLYDRPLTYKIIFNGLIILLCVLYVSVIAWSFSEPSNGGDFSSLEGVMTLFTNPKGVLAGWIHYLAFDMLTGLFIIRHSSSNGIGRWITLPCLFFTFMFGPLGLLMYYVLLSVKSKNLMPSYFPSK